MQGPITIKMKHRRGCMCWRCIERANNLVKMVKTQKRLTARDSRWLSARLRVVEASDATGD